MSISIPRSSVESERERNQMKRERLKRRTRSFIIIIPIGFSIGQSITSTTSSSVLILSCRAVFHLIESNMSWNGDSIHHRPRSMHRDFDAHRPRTMLNNELHALNLSQTTLNNYQIRPSPIPGNINNLSSIVSTSSDTLSTFNKERFHEVLQHGLGSYVFIENFGLVPKLNHY